MRLDMRTWFFLMQRLAAQAQAAITTTIIIRRMTAQFVPMLRLMRVMTTLLTASFFQQM